MFRENIFETSPAATKFTKTAVSKLKVTVNIKNQSGDRNQFSSVVLKSSILLFKSRRNIQQNPAYNMRLVSVPKTNKHICD